MSGRVVHFEIPFDDGDRAKTFYSQAFGWDVMSLPELDYTLVDTGPSGEEGPTEPGYIGGGMMQRQEPYVAPNIVIDVDNLEAALQAVSEAGGTVLSERQAVGDIGFSAYFRDTEGNLLGLWESAGSGS